MRFCSQRLAGQVTVTGVLSVISRIGFSAFPLLVDSHPFLLTRAFALFPVIKIVFLTQKKVPNTSTTLGFVLSGDVLSVPDMEAHAAHFRMEK